jgi:hypothetical protein
MDDRTAKFTVTIGNSSSWGIRKWIGNNVDWKWGADWPMYMQMALHIHCGPPATCTRYAEQKEFSSP